LDTLSFKFFPTVTEQSSAVAAADVCAAITPVFKQRLDLFPEVVNLEK
jgi:hypothetical protein